MARPKQARVPALWRNECPLCRTTNPGLETTPPTCAGCGQPLKPFRVNMAEMPFHGSTDGYSDDRYKRRGGRR